MAPHHHQNTIMGEWDANNEGQAINVLGSSSAGYGPDFGTGGNFLSRMNKNTIAEKFDELTTLQLRTSIHQKIYKKSGNAVYTIGFYQHIH